MAVSLTPLLLILPLELLSTLATRETMPSASNTCTSTESVNSGDHSAIRVALSSTAATDWKICDGSRPTAFPPSVSLVRKVVRSSHGAVWDCWDTEACCCLDSFTRYCRGILRACVSWLLVELPVLLLLLPSFTS